MPHFKYCLITIFFIFFFLPNKANAEFHLDKYGEALEINDFKEIYATGFPQILREVFNSYSELDTNKTEDKKKLDEVAEYLPLFKEKFIVGYLRKFEDSRHCGVTPSYNFSIVISLKEMDSWHITLYQNKQGKYEICSMMSDKWGELRKRRYNYLRKFKKYWI